MVQQSERWDPQFKPVTAIVFKKYLLQHATLDIRYSNFGGSTELTVQQP